MSATTFDAACALCDGAMSEFSITELLFDKHRQDFYGKTLTGFGDGFALFAHAASLQHTANNARR